jgi:hypothetical protein
LKEIEVVSFGELDRHQWRHRLHREEEGREGGEKEKKERELRLAHRVHNTLGPTVKGTAQMSQVHISFSLWFKFLFRSVHGLDA